MNGEQQDLLAWAVRQTTKQTTRPVWSSSTWHSGRGSCSAFYIWRSRGEAERLSAPIAQGRRQSVKGGDVVRARVLADVEQAARAHGLPYPEYVEGAARRWWQQEQVRARRDAEAALNRAEAEHQQRAQEAEQEQRAREAERRRWAEESARNQAAIDEALRRLRAALPAPVAALRLLGLDATAPIDEMSIRRAFRTKSRTAHPDAGGSSEAFIRLSQARDRAVAWARGAA